MVNVQPGRKASKQIKLFINVSALDYVCVHVSLQVVPCNHQVYGYFLYLTSGVGSKPWLTSAKGEAEVVGERGNKRKTPFLCYPRGSL